MGREQLDLAERGDPQLDAGAPQLVAGDALLDDAAALVELGDVGRRRRCRGLELHRRGAARRARSRSSGVARRREAGEVDEGVARPDTPSLSLTIDLGMPRAARRACATIASATSSTRVQVLDAERVRHADLGEQPAAAGLGARAGRAAGRRRTSGCRAQREVALELGGVVGDRGGDAPGRGSASRDPREQPGPVEQLLAERPGRRVVDRDEREPGPGVARDHARAAGRGSTRRSRGSIGIEVT